MRRRLRRPCITLLAIAAPTRPGRRSVLCVRRGVRASAVHACIVGVTALSAIQIRRAPARSFAIGRRLGRRDHSHHGLLRFRLDGIARARRRYHSSFDELLEEAIVDVGALPFYYARTGLHAQGRDVLSDLAASRRLCSRKRQRAHLQQHPALADGRTSWPELRELGYAGLSPSYMLSRGDRNARARCSVSRWSQEEGLQWQRARSVKVVSSDAS